MTGSRFGAQVLRAQEISKTFHLYRRPVDRLVEGLTGRPRHSVLRAVHDVSLSVAPGEALGILGANGAGKSTLLKMLSGVLVPDTGSVTRSGRITGLLELGTGFEPEVSGRGNIVNNGMLLGLGRDEIAIKTDAIIAFAELGQVIDEPIKTYSSGMQMRLGFAIAAHAEPACIVVDEALAVGDAPFQSKCRRFLRDFRAGGGAIIMVTHDLDAIQSFCDRACVMQTGRMVFHGEPAKAIAYYNRITAARGHDDHRMRLQAPGTSALDASGLRLAGIEAVSPETGVPIVRAGDDLRVRVDLTAPRETPYRDPVHLDILDRFGQLVFGTSTATLNAPVHVAANTRGHVTFLVTCRLQSGKYSVVARAGDAEASATFEVAGVKGPVFAGLCSLPARFDVDPDFGPGSARVAQPETATPNRTRR